MRKLKSKILLSFIFLFIAGGLFFARQSLSYSTNNTHPFLTEKIAEFHNLKDKKNAISKKEIGWMMKGAIQEDDPPRWIIEVPKESPWKLGNLAKNVRMASI